MIPEYLKGKSAIEICAEMNNKYHMSHNASSRDYTHYIEGLLLLAVKDALMNADGVALCGNDYELMGSEAECRAVVFLNLMLSKE